ncbi:hypothetical protein [Mycolicibacterium neworleansense]|uniref:hypothetical protein n=1 Tax=Mycolicibacterium neworleansense TaxID=146018 RepID=UPI0021F31BB9|nr:hypothetical protein [Mycolicibacterium neworleansense]MCV7362732.1 hypothetical protein [Mycolicibacterium neworleansense]
MTGDPIWLKIALGTVPVLAAVIAGYFAVSNTLNKRVERLKNLVEIQNSQTIDDPLHTVQRLIFRELSDLELELSPSSKSARRYTILFYCSSMGFYISWTLFFFEYKLHIILPAVIVSTLAGFVFHASASRAYDRAKVERNRRIEKLDAQQQQALRDKWL